MDIENLKQYLKEQSIETFGFNVFVAHNRKREIVIERQSAMYVLLKLTKLSLDKIGFVCSNGKPYDHATVLHAKRKTIDESEYKDRQRSVNFWYNSIGRYIGNEKYNIAEYYKLFQRIEDNLIMNEKEQRVWSKIKTIVKSSIEIKKAI